MHEPATATRSLARFLTGPDAATPPERVRRRARLHLLDTLGAGLAGATAVEAARALAAAERAAGGAPQQPGWAPVWGTARSLPAVDAARVNGIASHAYELDDTGGCDHSGAVVVPAVLAALALRTEPAGPDLLADAVVAGYEAARRAQTALGGYDAVNSRGWHSTGVCGPLGAAAGSAVVLGLDVDQTVHALGLAAGYAGGSWSFLGSGAMTKRLNVGRAAELGLGSVLLAEQGFTGAPDVVEAAWGGYLGLYGGEGADPAAFTDGLGENWQVELAAIKPYAVCRSAHAAVDGLLDLMAGNGWRASDLRSVTVETSDLILDMCGGRDLGSTVSAQMSMPFALATAALTGGIELAAVLTHRTLPQTRDLMDRIDIRPVPDRHGGTAPPTVHIDAVSGAGAVTVLAARGGRERRLSDEAIRAKFLGMATDRLGDRAAAALAGAVLEPDRGHDVRLLPALLQPTGPAVPG
jgi:2-methylcitrate dehydratase PrpD